MTVDRALSIGRLDPDPNCVDNPAFRETLGSTDASPLSFAAATNEEATQVRVRRSARLIKMLREETVLFQRLGTLSSVSVCDWRDSALDWLMDTTAPIYPREGYQLQIALTLEVRFLAVSMLDIVIRSFDLDRLGSLNKLALISALLYVAARERWEDGVLPWFYFHQIAQQFETADEEAHVVGAARGQNGLSAEQLEDMVQVVRHHFKSLGMTFHLHTPLDIAKEIMGRAGKVFGFSDILEHKGCLPNLETVLNNQCTADRSTFESLMAEFAKIYIRDMSLSVGRPSICGAALVYISMIFISHRPIITPIPDQLHLPLTPLLQAGQLDLLVNDRYGVVWSLANAIYRLRIDHYV